MAASVLGPPRKFKEVAVTYRTAGEAGADWAGGRDGVEPAAEAPSSSGLGFDVGNSRLIGGAGWAGVVIAVVGSALDWSVSLKH